MADPLSIEVLIQRLETGACSARELTEECLERIRRTEPLVGAFLAVDESGALAAADASDRRRREGRLLHRMDGIPFAVKDSFCTEGLATTAASRLLEGYLPPYDAEAVAALRRAGCVLLGKLNLDEFSMGSSTRYSGLGNTRNPLDLSRVAGGSSGGSAAAVSAGEIPFALGSDTGGSIRQPAAFCGVVGIKPTYGAISRYGLIAFSSSLDCVGTVTSTVAGGATVLELLMHRDGRDATAVGHPALASLRCVNDGVGGMRIAVMEGIDGETPAEEVRAQVRRAADCLMAAGARVESATLPSPGQALLSYYVISAVEAASNLARYDGVRFGNAMEGFTPEERAAATRGALLGKEVKRRIIQGTALLTGLLRERYEPAARHAREWIRLEMKRLFESFDLIVTPTVPMGAFGLDESLTPLEMREQDLSTAYANLAGIPAVSVPFGRDRNGMPLGMQVMAPAWQEARALRAARILEEVEKG